MIALAMDTFRSMHLIEKRGDIYVLLDGDQPGGVPEIAEDHDVLIPDIPALEIPSVLPLDVLARIEATQQRQEATQRRHDIMLCHIHSQLDWQRQCILMLMLERGMDPPQMSPAPAVIFKTTSESLKPQTSFAPRADDDEANLDAAIAAEEDEAVDGDDDDSDDTDLDD